MLSATASWPAPEASPVVAVLHAHEPRRAMATQTSPCWQMAPSSATRTPETVLTPKLSPMCFARSRGRRHDAGPSFLRLPDALRSLWSGGKIISLAGGPRAAERAEIACLVNLYDEGRPVGSGSTHDPGRDQSPRNANAMAFASCARTTWPGFAEEFTATRCGARRGRIGRDRVRAISTSPTSARGSETRVSRSWTRAVERSGAGHARASLRNRGRPAAVPS